MRAVLCHAYGTPETLQVQEVADPVPGPGEVLVEVHAAGLNFTDVLATAGRSQMSRAMPMVPGVEGAGVVVQTGEGVTRLRPGDRVLGHRLEGALAELCVYHEDDLSIIPDGMDMKTAATFYVASMTADYALVERSRLKPGELLLVIGAGSGAGLAAIQIGKALGAKVVGAASSAEKLEQARAAGADATVLYPRGPLGGDAIKALAADLLAQAQRPRPDTIGEIAQVDFAAGYHTIYDCVGGSYADAGLRALGWEGRYLSVGFSAGVPKLSAGTLLFKNAVAHGIQPADPQTRKPGLNPAMERMYGWWKEGKLAPSISEEYELADAPYALARLANRQATGRIVLVPRRS